MDEHGLARQRLAEAFDRLLGHRHGFLVGITLRDAARQGRDEDVVAAFLGGLDAYRVGQDLHGVRVPRRKPGQQRGSPTTDAATVHPSTRTIRRLAIDS